MATRYQVMIKDAETYAAIKQLVPGDDAMPATYDVWLNDMAQERHKATAAKNVIRQVEVDPAEFARYCEAAGVPCSAATLGAFAAAKATSSRSW